MTFFLSLMPSSYLALVALGLTISQGELFDYIAIALSVLCTVPIWGAAVVRAKLRKHRQDLLSIIAVLVSFGYALSSQNFSYFWQAAAITSLLLLGGWVQNLQISKISRSVKDLTVLVPAKAAVIDGLEIEHVETTQLEIGQVILVRPGSRIPADGYVIQGQSLVSQTEITGETKPLLKVPGDWVLAGSENIAGRSDDNGPLTIRVSAVGDDLLIHELQASVDLEKLDDVRFGNFAKSASSVLTLVTVAAGFIAGGVALVLGQGIVAEISITVSVLLAGQVALIANSALLAGKASSIAAKNLGVLVRDRKDFEALAKINHVVLGKTGILTRGYQRVGAIHLARNTSIGSEEELLALAAAVEMGTSHELGHLIIQEAAKRGLELPHLSEMAPIPGLGVSGRFDGSLIQVGNAGLVNVSGINLNPYDLFRVSNAYQEGSTVVFVSVDELLVGYIEFPDETRENSQMAIVELSGKHAITILSGDATGVVERLAKSLGLSDFAAEVLSTRKGDWIKERRASGSKILYVADGHYDASALAEADVAYAFNAGHSVHQSTANLVQVSGDPLVVPRLIALSKKTQRRTRLNIIAGLGLSPLLMVAGCLGVLAPVIAAVGLASNWFLSSQIVRLSK
ncbi:MAG: heavy metal translocating P-type ATPase [Micrococcales bacterium]